MLPEEVGPTLHTVTGQWCTMISFFHSWEPLRGKDQTQNCQDSGRDLTCSAGCTPKRPLPWGTSCLDTPRPQSRFCGPRN